MTVIVTAGFGGKERFLAFFMAAVRSCGSALPVTVWRGADLFANNCVSPKSERLYRSSGSTGQTVTTRNGSAWPCGDRTWTTDPTRNGWFCGGLHKLSSAGLLLTEQCGCTAVTQSEPVRNRQIRVYAINLLTERRVYACNGSAWPCGARPWTADPKSERLILRQTAWTERYRVVFSEAV